MRKLATTLLVFILISLRAQAADFDVLLGTYNGVEIRSNETATYNSRTNNSVGGVITGLKWQCVEFVRRYYLQTYDINLRSMYTGDANTWFDHAADMNLAANPQGSTVRPEIGDILTSDGGPSGHIAIIRSVTDSQVCVAEQNFNNHNGSDGESGDVNHCMNMTGNSSQGYSVGGFSSGYPIRGWLRQQHVPTAETVEAYGFGNIEWSPRVLACSGANRWGKDGLETNINVCSEVTNFCNASSPNVPEGNNRFQFWWRWAREFFSSLKQVFGTYASACTQTVVLRTISVPSNSSIPNSIVAGNGAFPSHAVGYGSNALITSAASSGQPDFVAKSVVLRDSSDKERYAFAVGNTIKVAAKFKNEGTADSPQAIEIRYYLSNGQKEDAHSDWVRITTSTIQASNMKVGDTHTENIQFTAPSTIGTYNVVACADRTQDNNNGNGQVVEKHESNNCSKEAVFTVARRTPEERKKFLRNLMQIIND